LIFGFIGLNNPVSNRSLFWFILSITTGIIGGLIFALTNKLYLRRKNDPGVIYAFDLFGGAFGAILTASFLLPVYGVLGLIFCFILLILINSRFIARLRG
jgi:hypothetical protein